MQAATYLVVIEDTPESRVAMRFAVQRAAHVGAAVELVSVVAHTEFLHFGTLQSAMAAEAHAEAERLLALLAAEAQALSGAAPATRVLDGEPARAILAHVRADQAIRALVLGTASKGNQGALVSFFAGEAAGSLPCILMLVPGSLEADRIADLA